MQRKVQIQDRNFCYFSYSDNTASNATLLRVQTVAGHLKGRMNVAKMDRSGDGAKTARRFNVKITPSIIL